MTECMKMLKLLKDKRRKTQTKEENTDKGGKHRQRRKTKTKEENKDKRRKHRQRRKTKTKEDR